jgi:SP family general alpha glucoside:H+ symporter-like MFS transporter
MAVAEAPIEKAAVEQIESTDATKEARIAAQTEHETTLWQALKSNKKAALWSAIISLTIIMEGYDIGR